MTAEIKEEGKQYWTVVSRIRRHNFRPLILKTGASELNQIIASTKSDAVRKRAMHFVSHNRRYSPSNSGGGTGPRRA